MSSVPPPLPPEGHPPPPGYPPAGSYQQPYPPAPYSYPPQGHFPYPPPRRSKAGLIALLSFFGLIAVAAALIFLTPVGKFFFGSGFMESDEEFNQRMAESAAAATAVMGDPYLTYSSWCDRRGGLMRFAGGLGQVSFYRDRGQNNLISTANYTLSGNRLTMTTASGAPLVADLERIDGSTMAMTLRGQTETVRHCF